MEYRQMPRTELKLSQVGFGVWTVATNWWGRIEEADRAALLENAVELGVNFFDTADTYGEGYGEEFAGQSPWAIAATTSSSPPSSATTSTTRLPPGWATRNGRSGSTGSSWPTPASRA